MDQSVNDFKAFESFSGTTFQKASPCLPSREDQILSVLKSGRFPRGARPEWGTAGLFQQSVLARPTRRPGGGAEPRSWCVTGS